MREMPKIYAKSRRCASRREPNGRYGGAGKYISAREKETKQDKRVHSRQIHIKSNVSCMYMLA